MSSLPATLSDEDSILDIDYAKEESHEGIEYEEPTVEEDELAIMMQSNADSTKKLNNTGVLLNAVNGIINDGEDDLAAIVTKQVDNHLEILADTADTDAEKSACKNAAEKRAAAAEKRAAIAKKRAQEGAALIVQKHLRSFFVRLNEKRAAALIIQKNLRSFFARLNEKRAAALIIRKNLHSFSFRLNFLKQKRSAVLIQKMTRGFLTRFKLKHALVVYSRTDNNVSPRRQPAAAALLARFGHDANEGGVQEPPLVLPGVAQLWSRVCRQNLSVNTGTGSDPPRMGARFLGAIADAAAAALSPRSHLSSPGTMSSGGDSFRTARTSLSRRSTRRNKGQRARDPDYVGH